MFIKFFTRVMVMAGTVCTLSIIPMMSFADTLAYINVPRLLDESPQSKKESKKLEDSFSDRIGEIEAKTKRFRSDLADFDKNSVLMGADEKEKKGSALRAIKREIDSQQQLLNEDIARGRNEKLGDLEKLISEVIIKIAEKEEIDLVVQQAVYASNKIDLTEKVLDELKRISK